LHVRVSEEEHAALVVGARGEGVSVSRFVIERALVPPALGPALVARELFAIRRSLRGVGVGVVPVGLLARLDEFLEGFV
jgi:hypothetical protein